MVKHPFLPEGTKTAHHLQTKCFNSGLGLISFEERSWHVSQAFNEENTTT